MTSEVVPLSPSIRYQPWDVLMRSAREPDLLARSAFFLAPWTPVLNCSSIRWASMNIRVAPALAIDVSPCTIITRRRLPCAEQLLASVSKTHITNQARASGAAVLCNRNGSIHSGCPRLNAVLSPKGIVVDTVPRAKAAIRRASMPSTSGAVASITRSVRFKASPTLKEPLFRALRTARSLTTTTSLGCGPGA